MLLESMISELEDFRLSVVEKYVKQQIDLSKREQNDFVQFKNNHNEKMEFLKIEHKTAKEKLERVVLEQQNNEKILRDKKSNIKSLEEKQKLNNSKINKFQVEIRRYEALLNARRAELEKQKRLEEAKISNCQSQIELFEKVLGLRIEKYQKSVAKITFIYIDRFDKEAEYWITVKTNANGGNENYVSLLSTSHPLQKFLVDMSEKSVLLSEMIRLARMEFRGYALLHGGAT